MKKHVYRLTITVLMVLICTVSSMAIPDMLIPGGCTVGIKLQTKGPVITGFEEQSPAEKAGLKKGDIITKVDGKTISTAGALKANLEEDPVVVTVLRGGKEAQFCVTPEGRQIGAYVRDSVAGIGTVTYYDPLTGDFGALGHGVNDAESGQLLPVQSGELIQSAVAQVIKGSVGTPGELKGEFDLNTIVGSVEQNCPSGIFGSMGTPISKKPLPVANFEQMRTGKATILSNVSGSEVKAYTVEILKLYPDAKENGRNMLLKITDKELLNTTGGIVQGMSGSPIIQDGKLIGAVTHVLVNDPTKGYGIFIENMLEAAG